MEKLIIREKLEKMIGQIVEVHIDRPIGSTHPKHNNIVYPVNYGYIKEIIAIDNEYQDVYLLGINTPVEVCKGKVYAVIERENDIEDKLIVIANEQEYIIEEIEEIVNFQEKYFKYKIVK